jgi:hypothetical protein
MLNAVEGEFVPPFHFENCTVTRTRVCLRSDCAGVQNSQRDKQVPKQIDYPNGVPGYHTILLELGSWRYCAEVGSGACAMKPRRTTDDHAARVCSTSMRRRCRVERSYHDPDAPPDSTGDSPDITARCTLVAWSARWRWRSFGILRTWG